MLCWHCKQLLAQAKLPLGWGGSGGALWVEVGALRGCETAPFSLLLFGGFGGQRAVKWGRWQGWAWMCYEGDFLGQASPSSLHVPV